MVSVPKFTRAGGTVKRGMGRALDSALSASRSALANLPKLETPKPSQPTPTQINRQDAAQIKEQTRPITPTQINRQDSAKTQPQTSAPQAKWNEVKLPALGSSYLTGEPSTMTLPYAAGQQAEAGRSLLDDERHRINDEMTPTALTHQERQQLKEYNYTKPVDVSTLLPPVSLDAKRRENFVRLAPETAGSEAAQKSRYGNTLMTNVQAATTALEEELDTIVRAKES